MQKSSTTRLRDLDFDNVIMVCWSGDKMTMVTTCHEQRAVVHALDSALQKAISDLSPEGATVH